MKLDIYSKSNIKLSETDVFEYNGEFMSIPYISTTINSPIPIPFDIGSYLQFRGDTFRLSYAPAALKQARPETSQEAFVYESVKFTSILDDLTVVDFLDVVLFDNGIHYSSQPSFDFFGDAKALADRIQANLDRIYKGSERWTITVHPQVVSEAKNISINNIKCWQALALVNSEFGLNFVTRGRTVTIGTEGVSVGKVFGYGKGKGLYDIRQTTNEDALIITRLRAYGSTRNLPYRYYNNLKDSNGNPYISESVYIPNLMLPSFPYDKQAPQEVYIDSPNISKYGVREGNIYFDGNKGTKEIYPSLEGMTADQLAAAGVIVSLPPGDNGALNECLGAENPTDDGILHEGVELPAYFRIYLKDLGFDLSERDEHGNLKYAVETVRVSMRSGKNESREFDVVDVLKDTSLGYTRYIVECKRVSDTSVGMAYPNANWAIESGDRLVILGISMPEPYVKAASQRVLSEAITYLAANDETKYTYTPSIDSKFMAENPNIGESIREGDIFLFEDTDLDIYGGVIIQSLKITFGNSIIPEYEVTLSNDRIASTLEKIQDAINGISSSGGLSLSVDQIRTIVKSVLESEGDNMFLRKDVNDIARGVISFANNIKSEIYLGGMDGKGWMITPIGKATLDSALVRSDIFLGGVIGSESFASGFTGWGIEMNVPDCAITTDFLTVRKSMKVYELVYSQIYGLGGSVMITDLNKILTVEDKGDYFSVAIDKMEDSMRMNLRAGDIVRMQRSFGVNIRYFYGEILSVSSDTFDIKIIDGDDVPEVGDVVFRMGNKTDTSRQGVIYLTSSDDKAPYIDVLDGITDQSMFEKVKVRMGNISGIRTKKGQQLKGYGIYAEGAVFENSTVFLENGDTIEQNFSVMEGRLASQINAIRNDISSAEGNILRNSSFTDNTFYWVTNDNISTINVGGDFLWFNANFYADKRSVTDIYRDGNRNVLRVLNATIYQPNANLNFKDSAEEGSYSFSLFYKVRRAGTLKVGISGTELYEEQVLTETTSYERLYKTAEWNKEGDFEISFTGEILIYGVSLFEDAMAGTIAKMWTQIYQNEEQIALRATKEYVDFETGSIREHYDSEISVMAEEIALKATKFYVDSETSRVTSEWQSGLSVKANQIEASVKQWTNNQLTNYSTISQTSNSISNAIANLNIGQYATTVWTSNQITNAVSAKTSLSEVKTMLSQTATDYTINISAFPLATQRVSNSFFNFNVNGMSLNRRIEVGTGENSDSFVCQGGISANTYDGVNHNIFLWAGGTFQQASINQSAVKIRHDGSGYLASGNISWNISGDLTTKGRLESNASGDKVVVDPSLRRLSMITSNGRTVGKMGFANTSTLETSVIELDYYMSGENQFRAKLTPSGLLLTRVVSPFSTLEITASGIYKNGTLVL